jgi:molybdate transport system ATP-binding protein
MRIEIEVEALKKFKDFDLNVSWRSEGGITALFGPSGAGKSLTLQCIAGLIRPDKGLISVDGKVYYDSERKIFLPPQKRLVGYVFQDYALFPHKTVYANVAYGVRGRGGANRRIESLLDSFGLDEQKDKYPSEISGGQKQRTALARAIASDPELLLLDEPLSALDEALRERFQMDILRLYTNRGIPMVYVTHNLNEVFTMAEAIVVIDDGKVVEAGDKETLLSRPRRYRTAELIGAKNILPCTVKDVDGGMMTLSLPGMDVAAPKDGRFRVGDRTYMGIKPLDVRMIVNDEPKANAFEAMVVSILPQEKMQRIYLQLRNHSFVMDMERHSCEKWKVRAGEKIKVSLRMENIFLCEK